MNHSFFDALKQVELVSVVHFVNQHCRFIEAFEHVLGRYAKQKADERIIVACLIAWGTNMGLGRMGEISDLGYHTLTATSDNFIRLETLRDANEQVSNAIAKLPIFQHYDIDEWENVQRIILSLALKSTTQSIIVGKLSSYARKNKTKRALWEYDNIIKSLYLLDYIDSLPLRRNVQRALNRGENYHKLRRALSYANFGKLRFKTELEQQLWGECSRLLTNCIIYYNASILSNLLEYLESLGDHEQHRAQLLQVSPVAWQHINFHGRYEFSKRPKLIDMNGIIQNLAQIQTLPELGATT